MRSRQFRPEIQGLRAIGALLVATYHIWIERVSGGVDVFFVISGFLVLGSLLDQADRTGRVDLWRYASGLMVRLLPLALLVIAATMAMAVALLPQTRWRGLTIESVASIAYLENWRLAFSAVDYLDRDEAVSPFQHFWALSVQGQFYVLFGGLVAALTWIRGRRIAGFNLTLALPLVAVFSASLAYSIYATRTDQAFAYFNTFARLWEFALGGLVAIALPHLSLQSPTRIVLGWVGVAAILSCGIVLNVSTAFPGYAALWPTAGAALVIIAGSTRSAYGADRFLAWAPLARVGHASYALYLWHWPLLIAYLSMTGRSHAGLGGGLAVFSTAIALAVSSTWLVEERLVLKRADSAPRFAVLKVSAVGCLLVVVAGGWYGAISYWIRQGQAAPLADGRHPGAAAFGLADRSVQTAPLLPGPLWARLDRAPVYKDGCHQTSSGTAPLSCVYGNSTAAHTIAVVGGSHSAQWIPALQDILAGTDWKIVTYTKSSCLFVGMGGGQAIANEAACDEWNKRVMARLVETHPDAIFTTSSRAEAGDEAIPPGWSAQMRLVAAAGIDTIAIRDTPWMGFDVAECVEQYGSDAAQCRRERSTLLDDDNPAAAIGALEGAHFLDLTDRFCDARWCYPVSGNVLMFHDKHHISASYAKTLAPILAEQLLPILRQIETKALPAVANAKVEQM